MNSDLKKKLLRVATEFGCHEVVSMNPIEEGLINKTFLVQAKDQPTVLIQQINTAVFKSPENIQFNYQLIYEHLQRKNFFIPAPVKTAADSLVWKDAEENYWRAFAYVADSFSINIVRSIEEARAVARCFGNFASLFKDFPAEKLKTVIPGFHNLSFRYQQFQKTIQNIEIEISSELKDLLVQLETRKYLVAVFESFANEKQFPLHVMHHDCKINNILFDRKSGNIICPVDMDTVMPGKFFSDLGDMVRTIGCTEDENSTAWDAISIKQDYYTAITEEYLNATKGLLTKSERQYLHYSGLILIYMQALRFMTDYLNGSVYYKIHYPGQNLHRAKNQLILLKSLEDFLISKSLMTPLFKPSPN